MRQALYLLHDDNDDDNNDDDDSLHLLGTYDHTNKVGMGPILMETYELAGKADILQIIPSMIHIM